MKTLLIRHAVQKNKSGLVEIVASKHKSVVEVAAEYADGMVKTPSGDIWTVKPCSTGMADLMTAEPMPCY